MRGTSNTDVHMNELLHLSEDYPHHLTFASMSSCGGALLIRFALALVVFMMAACPLRENARELLMIGDLVRALPLLVSHL